MNLLRSLFIIGALLYTGTVHAQSVTTTFSQEPFIDVPSTHPYFTAIEYLRSQSVIKGYADETFKPNASINRAEFVEFVINPFILDTNGRANCIQVNIADVNKNVYFSDVPKSAWYATNICFAKNKNIIDGYPDNTFRPARTINFVEGAKIISNVFSMQLEAYQAGEFWYRPYVQSLSNSHAIPVSVKRFNQILTRGEMAEIVYRLKMDATEQSYMAFDATGNILLQRAAVSAPVTTPATSVATKTYNRPSRRSIVKTAESR